MPGLQLSYTDKTGTTHPEALVQITNVRMQLNPPAAELELSLFHDAGAAVAGRAPFEERQPVALTPSEVASLRGQFELAVYQLLQQRAEFSSAQVV